MSKKIIAKFKIAGNCAFDIEYCVATGSHRTVYKVVDTDLVIKHSSLTGNNNPNLIEWMVWNKIQNTDYKKYFCPCLDISVCEQYLMMPYAPKNSKMFRKWIKQYHQHGSSIDPTTFNVIPEPLKHDISRFQQWGHIDSDFLLVDYGSTKNLKYILE